MCGGKIGEACEFRTQARAAASSVRAAAATVDRRERPVRLSDQFSVADGKRAPRAVIGVPIEYRFAVRRTGADKAQP